MDAWSRWPANVDIFVVDDGSDIYPAKPLLENFHLEEWQPTLQLWRVTRNIGFNSHGCRNLIAKYSDTDWIQFLDIDHVMYENDVAKLKQMNLSYGDILNHKNYNQATQLIHDYPGHINCFGVHKDFFWEAGGYDESFTGHHYGDREFLERLYANGVEKAKTNLVMELHGQPRHGIVTGKVNKTEYMDEDTFLAPLPIPEVGKLRGTKKQRLDFPFVKIL